MTIFALRSFRSFDDPVGIKAFGDQASEFDGFDQGRDADGVEAVAGQKDKPYQILERVGGPAPFDLPMACGPPLPPARGGER